MATAADKAEYDQRIDNVKKNSKSIETGIEQLKKELAGCSPVDLKKSFEIKLNLIKMITRETFSMLIMSRISMETLKIKNENILNKARKNIYLILQYFEEMVGKIIDDPVSEEDDNKKLFYTLMPNLEKFQLMQQIGYLLFKLEAIYGDQSKWKWSFVEMEGRLIRAFKNIIDFHELLKNLDPSIEGYSDRMDLFSTLMESIDNVSERYRNKYELTNQMTEDMNNALNFVSFKKRICMLMGDEENAASAKKKYESWNKKFNEDLEREKKSH